MKKKKFISAILASSLTLAATLGGCSLVSANVGEDLKQEIAEINITKTEDFDNEFKSGFEGHESDYAKYKELLGTTKVLKRELLSYFVTTGYSLYQQNGSYEQTFNTLVTQLVNTAALTQYAATYILQYKWRIPKVKLRNRCFPKILRLKQTLKDTNFSSAEKTA